MRKLIKIIFSPITLLVYIALTIMTLIVYITDITIKVLWIVLKPIRVILNFIIKLIKNKINHYKNKDSWKGYYD